MTPERWQKVKELLGTALEMPPAQRATYLEQACASDASLRADIDRLLIAEDEAGAAFLSSPASAAPALGDEGEPKGLWIGRRVGAYEIVENIGVGGMGEVFRAIRADDQYKREVAIKLVRVGADADSVIRRFKHERQILASLDHPNIAHLLDGGTTLEGVPYVVMDLIEGEEIEDYCDSRKLSTIARLELFLQVCSAVQYAHQRLIIHRDIKPSNILVTEDGVAKLLDFGIAKILHPDGVSDSFEPTMTLLRMLTPGYASPEQIKGEAITTATDVYSLGVVLYELLTGHHPYRTKEDTVEKVARAACEIEPRKPSSVVRMERSERDHNTHSADLPLARDRHKLSKQLAGDLDNIILMALRKEPQRRYSSVEQFAGDIRRHLENLPVSARKDTAAYRASKFVRRHKAGIGATVLIVISLVAGMAVTLMEKRRADRRFNDVRRLANSLLFEIHDSIKDLAGATPARELLVRRSQEYLDGLAQEAKGDPSLQQELATAYLRLGQVQGDPGQADLGDRTGALGNYRKGLAILETLSRSRPDDPKLQREMASGYEQLARISPVKEGEGLFRRAMEILEALFAKDPKDVDSRRALATSYVDISYTLGNPYSNYHSHPDALQSLQYAQKALDLREQLFHDAPDDSSDVYDVFESYHQVADMLWVTGHLGQALQLQIRAQSLMQDFVGRNPNNGEARRLLSTGCGRIETVQEENGQLADALATLTPCEKEIFVLGAADPQNMMIRRQEVSGLNLIGGLRLKMGDVKGAVENHRKAVEISLSVIAADASNPDSRHRLASSYEGLGNALAQQGNLCAALENSRKGVDLRKSLLDADPDNVRVRGALAKNLLHLGVIQAKNADYEAALESYRGALAILEPMARGDPSNWLTERTLADLYAGAGTAETEIARKGKTGAQVGKHKQQACDLFRQNLGLWRDIRARDLLINVDLSKEAQAAQKVQECDARQL